MPFGIAVPEKIKPAKLFAREKICFNLARHGNIEKF